jgi:cytosine/creatinine deaminase
MGVLAQAQIAAAAPGAARPQGALRTGPRSDQSSSRRSHLPLYDDSAEEEDSPVFKLDGYRHLLAIALAEARHGLEEGGIPIGAALFDAEGGLLGRGRNRRVQKGDPSAHGETDAFRSAGRLRSYHDTIMVTTLAPCWYCSGLIRQFGIGTVVVGESMNFQGGIEWLREGGVRVVDLHSEACIRLLADYIATHPEVWAEDIGEADARQRGPETDAPSRSPSTDAPATDLNIGLPEWVGEVVEWERPYETIEERMRLAIRLSRDNVLRGSGGPFGAAVFERGSGALVAVGVNSVERLQNSALHAEMVALMLAEQRVKSYTLHTPDLPDHELVSSCEPCAMCLGAALWGGVRRLVYGADREDALRLHFEEGPVFPASFRYLEQRGIEIIPDLLREEAWEVLALYASRGGLIYNG